MYVYIYMYIISMDIYIYISICFYLFIYILINASVFRVCVLSCMSVHANVPVTFLWVCVRLCVCLCPFRHTAYIPPQVLWTSIHYEYLWILEKNHEPYSPRWENQLDARDLIGWMAWRGQGLSSQQEPNTNQDLFLKFHPHRSDIDSPVTNWR